MSDDNSEGYSASGEEESDGGEGKRKMSKLQRKACPLKDDTPTSSDSGPEVISINDGEPSNQKLIDHPNFTQNEPKPFTKNAGDSDDNVILQCPSSPDTLKKEVMELKNKLELRDSIIAATEKENRKLKSENSKLKSKIKRFPIFRSRKRRQLNEVTNPVTTQCESLQ